MKFAMSGTSRQSIVLFCLNARCVAISKGIMRRESNKNMGYFYPFSHNKTSARVQKQQMR